MEPRNRFQGTNSASLCSLAGRYDNPIPTWFLVPIDGLKIPDQFISQRFFGEHLRSLQERRIRLIKENIRQELPSRILNLILGQWGCEPGSGLILRMKALWAKAIWATLLCAKALLTFEERNLGSAYIRDIVWGLSTFGELGLHDV